MQLSKIGIHDKYSVVHQHRHCACVVPRRPSSSSHHRAVPRRQVAVAVAPSLAVVPRPPSPSIRHRRPSPPIAVVLLVHRRCACAIPRCQGAIAPSLSVREPLRHCCRGAVGSRRPCRPTTPATCHAPPRPFVRMVVALPLLTLSLWHRFLCLSSVRLVVLSPRFSRCHLPSASTSSSHRAITSCHVPLIGPLIQLVKASPLLTLPPEDRA